MFNIIGTAPSEKIFGYLRLIKKALVYLWLTKSWNAFGIRVISRVCPGQSFRLPVFLRLLFPLSSLWVQLDRAVQTSDRAAAELILSRLLERKSIFFDASIPEINLASLESKVFEISLPSSRKFFERKLIYQCLDPSARMALDSFYFSNNPKSGMFKHNKKYFTIGKITKLWAKEPILATEPFLHTSRPPSERSNEGSPHFERLVDGMKAWRLENVFITEGCQVFDETNYYWYELAANPKNNFIAGFFQAKPLVRTLGKDDYFKISFEDLSPNSFTDGFLLAGRCSSNYFHWLIEYLPRLMAFKFDSFSKFDGPILIETGLAPQLTESLSLAMKALSIKNSVVQVDLSKYAYKFKSLQIINTPTIILDDIDSFPYEESAFMNLHWLNEYSRIFDSLKNNSNFPKKVYLRRTNFNRRKLINESAIHNYLDQNGFISFFPEALSFSEQVSLFANADIIVAQSGAALSNIIFCKQTCTVVVLVAEETKAFSVFSNLASVSGCSYVLCTGPLIKPAKSFNSKLNWHFSDFEVPITNFETVMDRLLAKAD